MVIFCFQIFCFFSLKTEEREGKLDNCREITYQLCLFELFNPKGTVCC